MTGLGGCGSGVGEVCAFELVGLGVELGASTLEEEASSIGVATAGVL